MGHVTLIFGFIRGPHVAWNDQFPLSRRNKQVIAQLPKFDDYPAMSCGMFAVPKIGNKSVVVREPVIHFGSSIKSVEFGDVPEWLAKFEWLLSRLYWREAEVHILTDITGDHRYAYTADPSIFEAYHAGRPQPTNKWTKTLFLGDEPS